MDKKHKQNLMMTIMFILVVSMTLVYMYNDFAFQTYDEVVYYDYILSGENEFAKVENIDVYHNRDGFSLGNGQLTLKKEALLSEPIIQLNLKNDAKSKLKIDLKSSFDQINNNYILGTINKKTVKLSNITNAQAIIKDNQQTLSQFNLKITPLQQLEGSNKDYRIENASIAKKMIRLGSLKTTNQKIIKKYPQVSLEYRYLKDKKGDKEDNDNYIVFKKITGPSKKLINGKSYGNYYSQNGDLTNKDLSVVVILSNKKDKYAFSIDLKTKEVGDYYG